MGITWQLLSSFSQISQAEWNDLALTFAPDFPFVRHEFLASLELSGSLGARTGWHPRIVIGRESGQLIAACPLFLKTNSYGEYIFDFSWAQAAANYGLPYYPKLVCAIPFTPATGPKILAANPEPLIAFTREWAASHAHSLHFLFTPEDSALTRPPFLLRHSFQYHWRNQSYRDFQDFLDSLKAKRSKEIRRERRHNFDIQILSGRDLTLSHAHQMYEFYLSTIDKKASQDYLTLEFFERVFSAMPQQLLLIQALKHGRPVAAALNFRQGTCLYGRYWGALEEHRNLHFELCYYQAIEYAIANHVTRFEAGAQGEHKFSRGFLPQLTYSAHDLLRSPLEKAIESFIEEEKRDIARYFEHLADHTPYRGVTLAAR